MNYWSDLSKFISLFSFFRSATIWDSCLPFSDIKNKEYINLICFKYYFCINKDAWVTLVKYLNNLSRVKGDFGKVNLIVPTLGILFFIYDLCSMENDYLIWKYYFV